MTSGRPSSPSPPARRTATFLLRQPRQVQGFREPLADGLDLTMIWIPPERFWMGSPKTEPEHQETEGPQHLVQLPGFFMGQTPITQAQWREVARWQPPKGERWERELDPAPSYFQLETKARSGSAFREATSALLEGESSFDQRPVDGVNWGEAMEFCRRLNIRLGAALGRTYTLPSEAQWEYACRAGTTTPFAFGETLSAELANYDASQTYGTGLKGKYRKQTTPVGVFPANAWGLHDMHGNVWEWCLDDYYGSYERAPTDGRALRKLGEAGDKQGDKAANQRTLVSRVLRGGSWGLPPGACRSAHRGVGGLYFDDVVVGFRVVCLPQGTSLHP